MDSNIDARLCLVCGHTYIFGDTHVCPTIPPLRCSACGKQLHMNDHICSCILSTESSKIIEEHPAISNGPFLRCFACGHAYGVYEDHICPCTSSTESSEPITPSEPLEPRLVALESPFGSPEPYIIQENIEYARKCLRDCILRGEAPFASHLLYTQEGVLDDKKPEERALGIELGFALEYRLDATVVYVDRGISKGMLQGIEEAKKSERPIEYRSLYVDLKGSV